MNNQALNKINQAMSILKNSNLSFNERLNTIVNSGLVSEKLMRKYAVWCAQQVKGLMYSANVQALEQVEANMENELELAKIAKDVSNSIYNQADVVVCRAAQASAAEAAYSTAVEAARVAAYDAAYKAAFSANSANQWNDAWNNTYNKVLSAAEKAQEQKLREMLNTATIEAFLSL
jgi:hypothetical protein